MLVPRVKHRKFDGAPTSSTIYRNALMVLADRHIIAIPGPIGMAAIEG